MFNIGSKEDFELEESASKHPNQDNIAQLQCGNMEVFPVILLKLCFLVLCPAVSSLRTIVAPWLRQASCCYT